MDFRAQRADPPGTRKTFIAIILKIQKFLTALLLMIFVSACSSPSSSAPTSQTAIASDSISDVIAKYRQEISQLMQKQNIPGLAIVVVDDQDILWAEGFGYTTNDHKKPITPDTIFNLESISKTFTATGVMMAVQDGLLDLDVPMTTYLPDFTVHSIFEEHPEQKITLRHLLSHTAGFTHEAPVGNNWDADGPSFEAHIRSISDTWLRFPVGTGYAYSNLGIDLALLSWRKGWWRGGQGWRYTALPVAALAETTLLAGWWLIGI